MYSWRILYVCGIDVHAYNVMNESLYLYIDCVFFTDWDCEQTKAHIEVYNQLVKGW